MTGQYTKALNAARDRIADLYPEEYAKLVLEEMEARDVPVAPCVTCGEPCFNPSEGNRQNGKATKHIGECDAIYFALRLHLPDYREKHRAIVARGDIRRADDPIKVASAERHLAGTAGTHGRWFIEGSMAWHAAVTASDRCYPIFDLLDERLQEQVRNRDRSSWGSETPRPARPADGGGAGQPRGTIRL